MPIRSLRIGTLDDDLTAIAGAVQHRLFDGPLMVWIDDKCRVYTGDPCQSAVMSARWIVGTFSPGHALVYIEEDLRAVAQERSMDAVLG